MPLVRAPQLQSDRSAGTVKIQRNSSAEPALRVTGEFVRKKKSGPVDSQGAT